MDAKWFRKALLIALIIAMARNVIILDKSSIYATFIAESDAEMIHN